MFYLLVINFFALAFRAINLGKYTVRTSGINSTTIKNHIQCERYPRYYNCKNFKSINKYSMRTHMRDDVINIVIFKGNFLCSSMFKSFEIV